MVNLREKILRAQINYYQGLICKHQQNVEIYLNQPVGIGEHPQFAEEIDKQLSAITCATDKIKAIDTHYPNEDDIPF